MKDARGRVIYVGKAKNLRRRLASYFQPHWKDRKTYWLVTHIAAIAVILVNNETESLVLENNLIKRYKPHYNRMLMGDESGYAYIILTGEDIPRFLPYRKRRYNKALEGLPEGAPMQRFGPYLTGDYRDALLEFVSENFQIRTCKALPAKVCLRYHLHKCSGVCAGLIAPSDYAQAVQQAVDCLDHHHAGLVQKMKTAMWACAESLEYERAQRIRDQLAVLESALTNQVVERDVSYDQDVVYFSAGKVMVAEIKEGILLGMDSFYLLETDGDCRDLGGRFLLQHYASVCPAELITNRLTDPVQVEAALAAVCQHSVKITLPDQGVELALLELCRLNMDYVSEGGINVLCDLPQVETT
jgi:excinuclease ABC subunit C